MLTATKLKISECRHFAHYFPEKRQRNRSQIAKESNEMNFIEQTTQQQELQQHEAKQVRQEKRKNNKKGSSQTNIPNQRQRPQKHSSKEDMKEKKSTKIEPAKEDTSSTFQNKDLPDQISSHLKTPTFQNPPLFQGPLLQSLLLQPHMQLSQTLSASQSAPLQSLTEHSQSTPSQSLSSTQPQSPQTSWSLSSAKLQRPAPSKSYPLSQQHAKSAFGTEKSTFGECILTIRMPTSAKSIFKSSPFQLQNLPFQSMIQSPNYS